MRNLLTVFLCVLSLNVFSQSLSGVKICIDPGHGGHDPANDRFIKTTNYWESEGNLEKAFFLKQLLEAQGAEIVLTRTENNDSDDISLSQRSAIANENDVDFFHSIHSNGWKGKHNYVLVLFRGYDTQPVYLDAKAMSEKFAKELFDNGINWSSSKYHVRGDWSYYPQWGDKVGLGVLRKLTMPGLLSEGSFHDYIPESWRLKNNDFLHHEAYVFARAYIEKFGNKKYDTGIVRGIVRDSAMTVNYFNLSETYDKFLPVNKSKVTLIPGDKVYNTDTLNNGYFMFDKLTPGDYKLIFNNGEGFNVDTIAVKVEANKSTFTNYFVQPDKTIIPDITKTTPNLNDSVLIDEKIELQFNIEMNKESVINNISVVPNTEVKFTWSDERKLIISPKTLWNAGSEYKIVINKGIKSKWDKVKDENIDVDFKTKSYNQIQILKSYPVNSDTVATISEIAFEFRYPINEESFEESFKLYEGNVLVNDLSFSYSGNTCIVSPANILKYSTDYKIELKNSLVDIGGVGLGSNLTINYKTINEPYKANVTYETFENTGSWKQPDYSGSTQGIDATKTVWRSTNIKKVDGSNSGQLAYCFSGESEGVCRVFNNSKFDITREGELSLWVYGDMSNNILELWFYDDSYGNIMKRVGEISWYGWKQVLLPITDLSETNKLHSIVLVQNSDCRKSGKLYFDNLQVLYDKSTDVMIEKVENKLKLYPNPVNEKLNIEILDNKTIDEIFVYSQAGSQKLRVSNLKTSKYILDVSGLEAGHYLVTVKTDDLMLKRKLVKY